MSLHAFPSIFNALALLSAFALMWRERRQFHSLFHFRIAVALLAFGRIVDLIQTTPISEFLSGVAWMPSASNLAVAGIGNVSDSIGLLVLVVGFIKTIQFERKEEELIHNLETLLPICAWCKKYRTESGDWKPIESYLKDRGAPPITHGICPECAAARLSESARRRQS